MNLLFSQYNISELKVISSNCFFCPTNPKIFNVRRYKTEKQKILKFDKIEKSSHFWLINDLNWLSK